MVTHRGTSSRAGRLGGYLLGIVLALVLTGCSTGAQTVSPISTPASPTPPPAPLSPKQAWGDYAATRITLPLPTTSFFAPKDVFPDGRAVVGVADENGGHHMRVMVVQVASGATHVLYNAPPDLGTTLQVQTDGRYVAWAGGNEGEGATSTREVLGYSDVQSGQVTMLADSTEQFERIVQLTHGTMVWMSNTAPTLFATDLATNTTTTLPITQGWDCGIASWPYLLCKQNNGLVFWELYNLTTHHITTPTTLGRFTQGMSSFAVALDGTTVFVLPSSGPENVQPATPAQLIEIDQVDQPSAKSHGLGVKFVASTLMANGRLVVWTGNRDGGAVTNQLYAWDRAQNRVIEFDPQQFQGLPQLVVRDHAVMIVRNVGAGQGDITVINTDTLPKAAGA